VQGVEEDVRKLRDTLQLSPARTGASRSALRAVALVCFAGYLAWNAWWLAGGRVPGSIFRAATGLPCPTTGGTRSALALLSGDIYASLAHNPFTLVFIGLLGWSVTALVRSYRRLGHAELGRGTGLAWFATLGVAWVFKLAQAGMGTSMGL
jgi:hypothetical protein